MKTSNPSNHILGSCKEVLGAPFLRVAISCTVYRGYFYLQVATTVCIFFTLKKLISADVSIQYAWVWMFFNLGINLLLKWGKLEFYYAFIKP